MHPNRKKYDPRLNCKGLPRDPNRDPEPTTERGRRRKRRDRHSHEFKLIAPSSSTSYDANRIANESYYRCTSCGKKSKGGK